MLFLKHFIGFRSRLKHISKQILCSLKPATARGNNNLISKSKPKHTSSVLKKNPKVSLSDIHHTNSQYINTAVLHVAQLHYIRLALHAPSTETGSHLVIYRVGQKHLTVFEMK